VQVRAPSTVLPKIVRYAFRQKNVPGIAAGHHPLGKVNTSSGQISSIIDISNFIHRATMNSHPQSNLGMALQRLADFQRAPNRSFRVIEEDKGHPVSHWKPKQPVRRCRTPELIRVAHDFIQLLLRPPLVVDQQFGVAHNVHEQDVGNFELDLFLGGHGQRTSTRQPII
jgi:hypothetical protein